MMEPLRTIEYTIDTAAPQARTRKWAGMQYEDNVTEIRFNVDTQFKWDNALYRIDFDSPTAGYHPSENLTINDGVVSRAVPLGVTQYGGDVQVTLVVTLRDDEGNETGVGYSYPHMIYFTAVEKDEQGETEIAQNISVIEASALEASKRAVASAAIAESSAAFAEADRIATEEARRALEEDAEFIFLGGDAEGSIGVELVIDDKLSEVSENPVQNKVILENINAVLTITNQKIKTSAAEINARTDEKISEVKTSIESVENSVESLETDINTCLAREYIVEQGTSNGWTYRKWSSGIMECWGLFSGYSVNYATGGLGYLHKVNFEYPVTFANSGTIPTAIVKFGSGLASVVSFTSSEYGCWLIFDANLSGTDATTEYTIALEVKGRWKEEG